MLRARLAFAFRDLSAVRRQAGFVTCKQLLHKMKNRFQISTGAAKLDQMHPACRSESPTHSRMFGKCVGQAAALSGWGVEWKAAPSQSFSGSSGANFAQ